MPIIQNDLADEPRVNETIWRFMNLPKFLDLVQKKKLFFSKVSLLEDPCEGMNNAAAFNEEYWREVRGRFADDITIANDIRMEKAQMDIWRNRSAVSCWHLSKHEPEAFWKLYSDKEFGVAIKSNINTLQKALQGEKRSLLLGKVQYIDYEAQTLPKGHPLAPMFYKRKAFKIENEVRLLLWCNQSNEIIPEIKGAGEYVDVDLDILLQDVYISPKSPPWFRELITQLLSNHKINSKIVFSSMNQLPKYIEVLPNYKITEEFLIGKK